MSGMGYRGKTTNSTAENVAVQAQMERESMWGETTGKIVGFDPKTQTASIQPDYSPVHNGKTVKAPVLLEVPVRFQRVGGFVITSPIKVGDKVTLRPQMRSTEAFHTGGDYTSEGDRRSFSLSDMEAFLDGGESLGQPIQNFNSQNFELRSEDGRFKLEFSEDGKFKLDGAQGNILELLTQVVDLLSTDQLQINHGSSAGSGHELQNRAKYKEIADKLKGMLL